MPDTTSSQDRHYQTVASAIGYIRTHALKQPSLADISTAVNLSESHLQRVFSEWAGISPKRFLQFLTKEHARQALRNAPDVLSVSLDTGLSSPGRLHDLMITTEAMTPGEIRQHGKGLDVSYGKGSTPFGTAMIAWTPRGICNLAFSDDEFPDTVDALRQEWSAANFFRSDHEAQELLQLVFSRELQPGKLHLLLRGTNFQIKVWEALLNIGSSQIISYRTLARMAGQPKAHRSVGSAMAANRIAYLVPCHRVIRGSGDISTYHWGTERKQAMQAWEAARNCYSPTSA